MSQPPPLPPDRPVPLSYGSARPNIALQAVLGSLSTIAAIVFVCIVVGFAVGMAESMGNATMASVIGVICLATLGAGLWLARHLRRNPMTRGWAIGIYIGMGLSALFWGSCGLILYSLSRANFH